MTAINAETLVSDVELAAVVGVSARRIRQLAEAGALERVDRAKYALGPSVRALLDNAAGTGSAIQRERTRLVKAQADRAEIKVAIARREVAPIEEFASVWAELCASIRVNVMNVPARAVQQLLGCADESEFKDKLRAELVLALTAAAEIDIAQLKFQIGETEVDELELD